MRLYIDIYEPDAQIIEATIQSNQGSQEQPNSLVADLKQLRPQIFDRHYFASDFYPESLVVPELRVNYNEHYYWYSTSPILVYSHTETTSEQIIFYSVARSELESQLLVSMVARLRALTLPIKTLGGRLLPPPRIWITYWDPNYNKVRKDFYNQNNQKSVEREVYDMNFGNPKFRLLAVVEAILYQIIASFPNGLPRVIETTLTFKEVIRPYKTVSFTDMFRRTTDILAITKE